MLQTFTSRAIMNLAAHLDDIGKPAWIGLTIVSFIVFWPLGLVVLGYLIGSGRMTCWAHGSGDRWQRRMERMQQRMDGCRRLPSSGPGAAIAARAATAPLTSTATRPCGGWKKSSANSRLSSTACGMPRTRLNSTSSWPNIAARSRDSPISRRASDHLNAFPASGEGAASQKTKMGKWGGKMGKMGSESICDLEIDSDPNSTLNSRFGNRLRPQFDPDPNSTPIRTWPN